MHQTSLLPPHVPVLLDSLNELDVNQNEYPIDKVGSMTILASPVAVLVVSYSTDIVVVSFHKTFYGFV
jgi:hypothetical protein